MPAAGVAGRVTRLLEHAAGGDPSALDRLLEVVYEELRGLARSRLAGAAPGQTLRPTDLVHEAWVRLVEAPGRSWENRCHFINAAGAAMRSVIVDRARARLAVKRGGDREREALHADIAIEEHDPTRILAIDEALVRLEEADARAARVVNLKIFLGLSEPEIAESLGVTDRTVQRDWRFARAWLADAMGSDDDDAGH